ncbi:sugar ABC transporter substrate-binding protein [Streptomyces sp. NBC_00038]|uniref:ABC transporter substrate-binding protein n=1 Tax=Streptomyces sp. NBC_00038 TaxID=2903615 RepID=UPI002255BEE7|nr:sugar ABC transporter substrate-binding protein [Streptomyces sp. NBC_00038]MCX5556793.1 sugar ABC transporter substrate-binding protein [Streptomyces sp. NBC_00038]
MELLQRKPTRTRRVFLSGALCAALLLAGCGGGGDDGKRPGARGDTTCDGELNGTTDITMWFHAGPSGEFETLRSQVKDFNAGQKAVRVELIALPEERPYTDLVESAAASGELPDLLDFDGPNLYNYAWSGKLKPIDSCVPDSVKKDLLPSIREQGTYAGRLWGVGTFDSGLGLYVRPSILKKAGIRVPSGPDDAWTATELTGILHKLRGQGYERPLDLRLNYSSSGGEWNTYGFAPAVWSAGGDLIDPRTHRTADGFLNSPEAVEALTTMQSWSKEGLIDPDKDDKAFTGGRSPISWVGHWMYGEYTKAFPGDVKIVPLPDFGEGTVTGMGSWQWGVTTGATDGDAVWRFLAYLLKPEQIRRMTQANGAIPATNSAVKISPAFAEGGPERLFIDQLRTVARPRSQTPAYPAVTLAFSKAFAKIVVEHAPVKAALDRAVSEIDKDLADHQGYPADGP